MMHGFQQIVTQAECRYNFVVHGLPPLGDEMRVSPLIWRKKLMDSIGGNLGYYYAQSIGCVGILKDWFTRALAEALAQGALTLTRADLARHAWSLEQCEKMAQDALDGEAGLAEQPEAMERLRTLLGLEAAPPGDAG